MMGRLPSCTAHDVDRVLIRQSFVVMHQNGSHRYYKSPVTGKIVTTVPMHSGDLGRGMLKSVIKQIGYSEEEFRRLL